MFALVGWLVLGLANAEDGTLELASAKPKAKADAKSDPKNDPRTALVVIQLVEEGWTRLNTGRPAEALTRLEKAVELSPRNTGALSGLGWALLRTDEPDAAEGFFKRALAVDPKNWFAQHGLGQISFLRRNYTAAEAYLRKAPGLAPEAWLTLAKINLLQGQYDEAAEWARKLVTSNNDSDLVGHILAAAIVGELDDDLRKEIEPPKRKGTPEADRPGKPSLKPSGKAAN